MLLNTKKKPIGIILWKGKSLLDGKRIMVIATGVFSKTENRKTGNMIQTWILRRDINPILARRMGEDYSICGNCKAREKSTCYVNLGRSPFAIFNAYHDDRYKMFEDKDLDYFRGRSIRIGSYGDPSCIPYEIWENICEVAKSWTGYTHQWDNKKVDPRLKYLCMASVDSIKGYMKEYEKAQQLGWRTFRIRESLDNPLTDKEFICPASKEGGVKTTCEKCNSCNGLISGSFHKSPVIVHHADSEAMGSMWRLERYIKMMKLIKWKKSWRRDYQTEKKKFKEVCPF